MVSSGKLAAKYRKEMAWGLLTSCDLHGCSPRKIRSAAEIRKFTRQLCGLIGLKRYGPCRLANFGEREEIAGYSMTQLIETSLVSAHFVNKTNKVFLDVFSCSYYDPKVVADFAKKFFEAKSIRYHCLLRE